MVTPARLKVSVCALFLHSTINAHQMHLRYVMLFTNSEIVRRIHYVRP
jgi:hypothetical protein